MGMHFRIQTVIFPSNNFTSKVDLYIKSSRMNVAEVFSSSEACFGVNDEAYFDTFFNALSVAVWKKNTCIDNLSLQLLGRGKFRVRVGIHAINGSKVWLEDEVIELTPSVCTLINIKHWKDISDGLMFFSLLALEPSVFCGASYTTTTLPAMVCKIGIVITHYNRKEYVLPAINRINNQLLHDPSYQGNINLIVVDNSKSITVDESKGVKVIPNQNLGGSGGFTRGLLHLIDEGDYTHCIFMDDDASCEIESIRRVFALHTFSDIANLAIAGSILDENETHILKEKGAVFNGKCIALKSGLDMLNANELLEAEIVDGDLNYGGWWLFSFPLNRITEYPFPFFIRGDDVRFSIANDFNIISMNGISTWGADFQLKDSPMMLYFDVRSHLLNSMNLLNIGRFNIALYYIKTVLFRLLTYRYASAQSAVLALRDFMFDADLFAAKNDLAAIKLRLDHLDGELMSPIVGDWPNLDSKIHSTESLWRKLLRVVTINGLILPIAFYRKETHVWAKSRKMELDKIFCYQSICYYNDNDGRGYIAQFDRWKFISIFWRAIVNILYLLINFNRIKMNYSLAVPRMTTLGYWRKIFEDHT